MHNESKSFSALVDDYIAAVAPVERHVMIHLVFGATPKALRKAIKAAGLLAGPAFSPRVARAVLRGDSPLPTNADVALAVAAHLPKQSTVHVRDIGPIDFAIGTA